MAESPTLIRDLELPQSQDFYFLREKGIEFIQQLGRQFWTDYNIHDPGITIMEAFSYALTDLGYRTGYLMKDILTRDIDGVPTSVGEFHSAREILSCNPVTFDDIRALITDVRGVRNAWVIPYNKISYELDSLSQRLLNPEELSQLEDQGPSPGLNSVIYTPPINGLYQVLIEYEEFVKELKVGVDNNACVSGNYIPPQGRGLTFQVFADLTIREFSIYAETRDEIIFHLLDQEGQVQKTFSHIPSSILKKEYVNANLLINFDSGKDNIYHLVAEGNLPRLFSHPEDTFSEDKNFILKNYLQITGGYDPQQANSRSDQYYFFYDWEIERQELQGEQKLIRYSKVGLDNTSKFSGKAVVPQSEGIQFDAECPLTLEKFCINAIGTGSLSIGLYDDFDQLVDEIQLDIDHKGKSPKLIEIVTEWDVPACQGYTVKASTDASDLRLFMNEEAEFPYRIPGVIVLLGGEEDGVLVQKYNYFYDWEVSYEQKFTPEIPDEELTSAHVKDEVRKRLRTHRNLSEDLIKIKPVETEEIGLYADVEFEGEMAEDILAEIYCIMETYVKPPVKYYTWHQLLERGVPSEEIFSGPTMQHGFLDPIEFAQTQRKAELRVSDIVQEVMKIPGVKLVKNIYLTSFINGQLIKRDDWILCLEVDDCFSANFNPKRSGVSLYRNGIPYQCNYSVVANLLNQKNLNNRAVKLKGHSLDISVPIGEDQELADFYPMQNDLPINYLVGQNRVPHSATQIRRAQSNQLKAFLMFFEQILANFLSQMEHMPELFSWKKLMIRDEVQTYFTQQVQEIEGLQNIYKNIDELPRDVQALIEKPEDARERKNKFLDHLLARFAEDFSSYSTLMYALLTDRKETAIRLIEDKQLFLQNMPDISANRALATDLSFTKDLPGLSGFQRRICHKLGMYSRKRVPLDQIENIEAIKEKGLGWYFYVYDDFGNVLFKSVVTPDRQSLDNLIDFAVFSGKDLQNYKNSEDIPGCSKKEGTWTLVSPCYDSDEIIVGTVQGEGDTNRDLVIGIFSDFERPTAFLQPEDFQFKLFASDYIEVLSELVEGEEIWYFIVKSKQVDVEIEIFRSVACPSRTYVEELLEHTLTLGSEIDNYIFNADTCSWDLYACEGDGRSLVGKTSNLLYRNTLMDIFDEAKFVEGMHLIEHVLLRPRTQEDKLLPVFYADNDSENANETGKRVLVADPYTFRITLVMPAWSYRFRNLQYRQFVEDLIRREAPAHIYLNIYWVSYVQMKEFEPLYINWLKSLSQLPVQFNGSHPLPSLDYSAEAAAYSKAQNALVKSMLDLKNIYPKAKLYDPASQQTGDTQTSLGNMTLGQV